MGSDGRAFTFSEVQQTRLARAEQRKRRYQRRMARCEKVQVEGRKNKAPSKGYQKLKRKVARQAAYARRVREDFAHQTSHALASSDYQVFAFEALNIKDMTAKPAPKQDAAGRYTANGAAAKAGLNGAILASAWGLVRRFTAYKARKRNKLIYQLPAAYSSQTCAKCGHCSADNRKGQTHFDCEACGYAANADENAARVLKQWALQEIRAGKTPAQKEVKRVAFVRKRKQALEQELLEVTSDSGASKPPAGANASTGASLRCAA
jgi:putative transposase